MFRKKDPASGGTFKQCCRINQLNGFPVAGYPFVAASHCLPVTVFPAISFAPSFVMAFVPFITATDPHPIAADPNMFMGRRSRSYINNFGGPFPYNIGSGAGRKCSDTKGCDEIEKNSFHDRLFLVMYDCCCLNGLTTSVLKSL